MGVKRPTGQCQKNVNKELIDYLLKCPLDGAARLGGLLLQDKKREKNRGRGKISSYSICIVTKLMQRVCLRDNRMLLVFKFVAPLLFSFLETSVGISEGCAKSTASFFP